MKDRFKEWKGYRFDRVIFNIAMFTCFIFLFLIVYINDFDLDYYNCPRYSDGSIYGTKIMLKDREVPLINNQDIYDEVCENPFYKDNWKSQKYLPVGEYGFKPTWYFDYALEICLGLILVGFLINHLIYNRGKKYDNLLEFDK